MFKSKKTDKMDMDILDQIIGKCEDKMVSPFKKKTVAVEMEPAEGTADEESLESPGEESAEKPDLSDMDLADLLKLYQEQHGK